MTLYGAAKTPAAALTADGTVVVALTDSSTGTVSETLAAVTNIAALTDSTSGQTVTDIKQVVPGGSGQTAGAFNDETTRDAAIVIINDNAKAFAIAMIAQKAVNTALTNAIASLANKLSDLITHLNDGR